MFKKLSIKKTPLPNIFKLSIILIILTHLIAVIFSEGFHRPDEHLGVFRMMSYKLGKFPLNELSWEYPTMIRPWLQPAIFFFISKTLGFLGFINPFFNAFILRLLCSLLGIYALYLLMKHVLEDQVLNQLNQKVTLLSFALLWFLPFFQARTTAENLGISFMIFALNPLFKYYTKGDKYSWKDIPMMTSYFSGIMLGLSFILRFQMGIMIFFFLIWCIFFAGLRFKKIIVILFGIFSVAGISTIIDYWGYGSWTFSPWNYFYQNLILKKASGFGVSPWYYYIKKTFEKGYPPFSLFIIIPSLWFMIKKPRHLFTWLVLPFFIIHSLIGHKELRFIFGLGVFLPFFIGFAFDQFISNHFHKKFPKFTQILKALLIIALIENSLLLVISIFKPAYTPISFYKHLYYKEEKINKIYTMRVFRDQLKFYLKNPIKEVIQQDKEIILKNIIKVTNQVLWFQTNNMEDIEFMEKRNSCKRDYLSYPDFIFKFKKYLKRSKVWALYRCEQETGS